MKIACESCGAKYSIADEKVGGKVFKIRCKRCSEVIVVRGDQQAAAAPAAPAGGEAIWHVVIDGDQAGPYAPSQLAEMLTNGTVDWEAYVWTEGFDNWVPMRDVPDLVAQITSGGQSQTASRTSEYDVGGDAFGAQPSMGADPFADDGPTTFQPSNARNNEPDLFASASGGRAEASPFDGGHVVSSASSPRAAAAAAPAGPAMTGARNENSVLFSLKNLQALATSPASGGGAIPVAAASAPGQARAGIAGGEGSGLIDIRALASATGVGESEKQGAKDELLSLGTQSAFGALGSPMLAPVAAEERGGGKTMMFAIMGGVAVLCVAIVAAAYILRAPAAPVTAAVGTAAPATAAAAAAAPAAQAPSKDDEDEADKPSEGELAAKAAAAQQGAAAAPATDARRPATGGAKKPAASSGSSETAEKPAAAETKPAATAPAKPSGPRSIDDLLDGALGGGGAKKAQASATAPPKSNLPDLPSRDDVVSAMGSVKGAVSACAQGQTGVAFVNVSVAGATGRVTAAEVTGITGPAGSCIAKAVRGAQFPKFQQSVFKVKYPFKL